MTDIITQIHEARAEAAAAAAEVRKRVEVLRMHIDRLHALQAEIQAFRAEAERAR